MAPRYLCAICGVGVYICRGKTEQTFYFKHWHEDNNCPAQTRFPLSQEELSARKYNGAKESKLHRTMKDWSEACLHAYGRFESISKEPRWVGSQFGEWRKPDVRATFQGIPIAFEIQLSTTYLNVIVERRQFYLEQGGLLFWIFAEFDCELRRMTEDDVFYNNNQNAFIVDANTVAESLERKEFTLECVWAEPLRNGGTSGFHRKRISFHELTLDPAKQQAFYFDFEGRKTQFEDMQLSEAVRLRQDFEAWFGSGGYYAKDRNQVWADYRERFRKQGVTLPPYFNRMDTMLLTCLYSAKNNKPWGQKRSHLVEVAHQVANAYKHHLKWFMHAVRRYGRLESMKLEGHPQRWKVKYDEWRAEHADELTQHLYHPKVENLPLVEFLFPELCPFPR